MSFDSVRSALATKVNNLLTAFDPTIRSQFENQESVDMNVTTPWVEIEIHLIEAKQSSLETTPRTRYEGELQTRIYIKAGSGTKRAFEISEALARGLEYGRFGTANMRAPRPLPGRAVGDWYCIPLMTSFYTDTN